MKLFSDNHTHPLAHDPHRKYSEELLMEWVDVALQKELTEVTFTDHDRFHPGIDIDIMNRVQDRVADKLRLNMGIELDNDPETSSIGRKWTEKNYDRLDYVLGSIHFIGDWPYDHPDHIKEFEKWNITKLYTVYFKEIQRIAHDDIYDCLAHLDLIKIFKFLPESDVSGVVLETLDIIKENDIAIELNCAGWHKPVKEQYPNEFILSEAIKRNIPITVSSDAHAPSQLARTYTEAGQLLEKLGLKEVALFRQHERRLVPLS